MSGDTRRADPAGAGRPEIEQPGDLVFFYSPVSHVGIYIGTTRWSTRRTPVTW